MMTNITIQLQPVPPNDYETDIRTLLVTCKSIADTALQCPPQQHEAPVERQHLACDSVTVMTVMGLLGTAAGCTVSSRRSE